MTFNNLQRVLDDFTKDVAETYKSLLLRDGKNATGELRSPNVKSGGTLLSSIRPMTPELVNGAFECSLSLAPHWKYVENGRRPGKFPPVENILEWVKAKPQLARPNRLDRKELAPKQLAFLVARKIANKGIQPGNQLEEAMDIVYARWKDRIDAAITADIETVI